MSMQAFQRAVVDLTLVAARATALRKGNLEGLAQYDLTPRERDRILDIVRQPGISVSCTLSRGNRLETIAAAFPMTCVLLEPVLRELLDELWQQSRPMNYQLRGEETAFADLVNTQLAAGWLSIEYLEEVFAYEKTCLDLARQVGLQADPDAEVEALLEFQHSPDELLPPLSQLVAPPSGLPRGIYRARVKLQGEQLRVEMLEANPEG